jgi:hypothetical protein
MAAGIIGRRNVKPQPRRRANVLASPIGVSSAAKSGSVATIVFNQAVSLDGVPKYTTNLSGITATAASLTSPTTVALTFSASIATATSLNIPFEEPAVRNASGGYANAGTFPVS